MLCDETEGLVCILTEIIQVASNAHRCRRARVAVALGLTVSRSRATPWSWCWAWAWGGGEGEVGRWKNSTKVGGRRGGGGGGWQVENNRMKVGRKYTRGRGTGRLGGGKRGLDEKVEHARALHRPLCEGTLPRG